MKLLIAHENKANLGLLRAVLEDEGFTVVEAMDVAQGLKLLKEHGPDAIISDLPFPKVAGYRAREEDRNPKERKRSFAPTIMAALRLAPRRFNRVLRGRAARRRLRHADGDSAVVVRTVEKKGGDFERLRKAL
jgi:CheY-like chemotaxis protein